MRHKVDEAQAYLLVGVTLATHGIIITVYVQLLQHLRVCVPPFAASQLMDSCLNSLFVLPDGLCNVRPFSTLNERTNSLST